MVPSVAMAGDNWILPPVAKDQRSVPSALIAYKLLLSQPIKIPPSAPIAAEELEIEFPSA